MLLEAYLYFLLDFHFQEEFFLKSLQILYFRLVFYPYLQFSHSFVNLLHLLEFVQLISLKGLVLSLQISFLLLKMLSFLLLLKFSFLLLSLRPPQFSQSLLSMLFSYETHFKLDP